MAVLIAAALVFAMGITVFAGETPAPTYEGTITVSNATEGQTYTLYKVFDATVIDNRADGGAGINYTSDWFTTANDYFDIDSAGNITYKGTGTELSAGAIEWLKGQVSKFDRIGEPVVAGATGSVAWNDLDPGYYFIDTTVGTAVTVTSITPDVVVVDKNEGDRIAGLRK